MNSVFLDPTLDLGVAVSATLVLVAAGLIAVTSRPTARRS